MFAVLSDIHANREALLSVLSELDKLRIRTLFCLGDTVGYGAAPVECVQIVRDRCHVTLRGNHEEGLSRPPQDLQPAARRALKWSRQELKPKLFKRKLRKGLCQFLESLPSSHQSDGNLFVHGSPRNPVTEYLRETDAMDLGDGASEAITANLKLVDRTCFVGHTHVPGVIDRYARFFAPQAFHNEWRLDRGPTIINVGSVGQPRDGDPRACFVTVKEEVIRFHRVSYDVEATQAEILAQPELDNHFAKRLSQGL
ncbi:MAG: metallophosphoesterase family protein [Planctomycetota bacterium]